MCNYETNELTDSYGYCFPVCIIIIIIIVIGEKIHIKQNTSEHMLVLLTWATDVNKLRLTSTLLNLLIIISN